MEKLHSMLPMKLVNQNSYCILFLSLIKIDVVFSGNRDIIEYLTQMATKDEMTLHDAVSKGIQNKNSLKFRYESWLSNIRYESCDYRFYFILGDIENVNRLVKLGDINSLENNGKSALHLAAIKGIVLICRK